jgi:hypothetical protein
LVSQCGHGEIPGTFVMNHVRIPEEIMLMIFSYLDGVSLARAAKVCKSWYRLHKCESLWKRLAKEKFPDALSNVIVPPTSSWRIYYASKLVNIIIIIFHISNLIFY